MWLASKCGVYVVSDMFDINLRYFEDGGILWD